MSLSWWLSFYREPEHVVSEELWNSGDGLIRFNHVQQSLPDVDYGEVPNIDLDPWGITDGGYRGPGGS